MDQKELKKVLANLNIPVNKNGKVKKEDVKKVLATLSEKAEAMDHAEAGHRTAEMHDKVLECIGEWREYAEGYNQPENEFYQQQCLKALDCATHCLSMAADMCGQLGHDEGMDVSEEEPMEEAPVEEVEEPMDLGEELE